MLLSNDEIYELAIGMMGMVVVSIEEWECLTGSDGSNSLRITPTNYSAKYLPRYPRGTVPFEVGLSLTVQRN